MHLNNKTSSNNQQVDVPKSHVSAKVMGKRY